MERPLISIVIPSYQHAKELPDCLESIFAQDYPLYEVIVVNDGSTDTTDEVIKPYLDKITYIQQENRGGNAARNRGFKESTGDYVIFCDADIIMERDFLSSLYEALQQHPEASYAYSSFRFGFKLFKLWPFNAEKLRQMNYIHTTSLIRREHFPGFDENIRRLQDWDLWLTMLEEGHVGVWIPRTLFKAIPHEGGISTWVPSIAYRIPWHLLGIHVPHIEKFRTAREILGKKHELH